MAELPPWTKYESRVNFNDLVDSYNRKHAREPKLPEDWSMYTGVTKDTTNGKWKVVMKDRDGKQTFLGIFDDETTAAEAYDKEAEISNMPMNFPKEGQQRAVKVNVSRFKGFTGDYESFQQAKDNWSRKNLIQQEIVRRRWGELMKTMGGGIRRRKRTRRRSRKKKSRAKRRKNKGRRSKRR